MGSPHMNDGGSYIKPVAGTLPAAAAAGTRYSAAIDRRRFFSAALAACTGAASGAPDSFSAKYSLQESANGSSGWVDVEDSEVEITAANTLRRINLNLQARLRYVRVKEVAAFVGGTGPAIQSSSQLILAGAEATPTAL
ncbi:MAG: hypothetical protein ACK4N5_21910 [Myxococcales bacterium]